MIIILSPAKTFQETRYKYQQLPFFQNEAEHMNAIMKEKTIGEIEDEMQVSKKIATSVFAYAQTFGHTIQPAIHTYFGAAYKALHAKSLSKDDHRYAEKHVRILSALYGILKPLDGISFYRLDYKDRILGDLYDFWRPRLSEYLSKNLQERVIVNLASKEYASVLADFDMITISFKSLYKGNFRTMSMEAKRMRGIFTRMMIEKRIEDVRQTKAFVIEGYRYSDRLSNDREYVFIKDGE
jgi:uncharacterized protein